MSILGKLLSLDVNADEIEGSRSQTLTKSEVGPHPWYHSSDTSLAERLLKKGVKPEFLDKAVKLHLEKGEK